MKLENDLSLKLDPIACLFVYVQRGLSKGNVIGRFGGSRDWKAVGRAGRCMM
jgi:hypothetical protein